MVELCASILSADFARLAEQVAAAERGGATVIHVDVMDGHFVPNLTIGPPVVKWLRKATRLPLDCHLMIENADQFIPDLAEAGANWVIVHYEACVHLHRTLQLIAHHGMQPAVVVNPATRVDLLIEILPMVHHVLIMSVNPGFGGQEFIPFSLDKIRRLAELRQEMGLAFRIEVDGGSRYSRRGRPSGCRPAGGRECRVWGRKRGAGCARSIDGGTGSGRRGRWEEGSTRQRARNEAQGRRQG
jgi:ribulose-phosphate 3-epimerase